MGSFRQLSVRRAADTRTITIVDKPELVAASDWLGEGESVTFWGVLPHGVVQAMVAAGSQAKIDRTGNLSEMGWDTAAALKARIIGGIVDWRLFDESGMMVEWNPAKGGDLLDGLPNPVYQFLMSEIGKESPKTLSEINPDAAADGGKAGETLGEA